MGGSRVNKASVLLIVIRLVEGCYLLIIEAVLAPYSGVYHVALINFSFTVPVTLSCVLSTKAARPSIPLSVIYCHCRLWQAPSYGRSYPGIWFPAPYEPYSMVPWSSYTPALHSHKTVFHQVKDAIPCLPPITLSFRIISVISSFRRLRLQERPFQVNSNILGLIRCVGRHASSRKPFLSSRLVAEFSNQGLVRDTEILSFE